MSEDRGALTFDAMSDPLPTLALTLVVITRDAGASLAECLGSVRFASQSIVVDSGSRDNTAEIARNCGALFIEQPWMGFGRQKNFAVAQAGNDWVLCLDADERVSPELAQTFRDEHHAYEMPRRNLSGKLSHRGTTGTCVVDARWSKRGELCTGRRGDLQTCCASGESRPISPKPLLLAGRVLFARERFSRDIIADRPFPRFSWGRWPVFDRLLS
jgi:glycosyltransferase involved in cell wall biosynthesis